MSVDFEVIMIGAGPAGVTCTKKLAEQGISHLVKEAKKTAFE